MHNLYFLGPVTGLANTEELTHWLGKGKTCISAAEAIRAIYNRYWYSVSGSANMQPGNPTRISRLPVAEIVLPVNTDNHTRLPLYHWSIVPQLRQPWDMD